MISKSPRKKMYLQHLSICVKLSINSLLYAHDIELLANSKEQLRNVLDIVDDFCTSWKQYINMDKSKVVVFDSNEKHF